MGCEWVVVRPEMTCCRSSSRPPPLESKDLDVLSSCGRISFSFLDLCFSPDTKEPVSFRGGLTVCVLIALDSNVDLVPFQFSRRSFFSLTLVFSLSKNLFPILGVEVTSL